MADQYNVATEKIRTDQDLTDLLRKKVRGMREQQLVRTLIELALLPFGHSYKELSADNPLVLAAKRNGGRRSEGETNHQEEVRFLVESKGNSATTEQATKSPNLPKAKAAQKGGAA